MQNSPPDTPRIYRERLSPSLPFFVVLALAGPMVALSFVPVGSVLALVLGVLVTVLVMVFGVAVAPVVSVEGTMLRAGRARIDARWLGEVSVHTGDDARNARGPGLSARGWHLIRGGIDGLIVVKITDPDDPVTTWTISTRTPDRLASAIERAQAHSRQMGPAASS